MTPQLQQAIRLLQLSNIELGLFVETELERNPLLERDEAAPEPSEERAAPRRGHGGGRGGDLGGRGASGCAQRRRDAGHGRSEWRRAERARRRSQARRAIGMGVAPAEHAQRRRGRGHQPGRVRRRRRFAGRPSDRAAAPGDHRSRRAADRRASHPHGRRGRLSAGQTSTSWPTSSARPTRSSPRCWQRCRVSIRPACSRAIWPNAWRCSSRSSNRYDPQIAKLLDNLPLLGSHNLAALKRAVGVDADELVEMIAEIKQLNPKPGLKFGSVQIQPVLPDVIVRPGTRRQLVGGAQQRHAAARARQPQLLQRRSPRPRAPSRTRATCSTACRTPTGWSRASTSAHAPSCAWPRRSCASRTAS